MVYLLADWGMGDSQLFNQSTTAKQQQQQHIVLNSGSIISETYLHHQQKHYPTIDSYVVATSASGRGYLRLGSLDGEDGKAGPAAVGSREDGNQSEVDLHPLSNQVGGHTRLMVLNPSTILKPLNYRELDFYQNIQDQDIKMFVPKYKGVMQASVCSGGKMEKRYSPSFRDDNVVCNATSTSNGTITAISTTTSATSQRSTKSGYKRKREEVLNPKFNGTKRPDNHWRRITLHKIKYIIY